MQSYAELCIEIMHRLKVIVPSNSRANASGELASIHCARPTKSLRPGLKGSSYPDHLPFRQSSMTPLNALHLKHDLNDTRPTWIDSNRFLLVGITLQDKESQQESALSCLHKYII